MGDDAGPPVPVAARLRRRGGVCRGDAARACDPGAAGRRPAAALAARRGPGMATGVRDRVVLRYRLLPRRALLDHLFAAGRGRAVLVAGAFGRSPACRRTRAVRRCRCVGGRGPRTCRLARHGGRVDGDGMAARLGPDRLPVESDGDGMDRLRCADAGGGRDRRLWPRHADDALGRDARAVRRPPALRTVGRPVRCRAVAPRAVGGGRCPAGRSRGCRGRRRAAPHRPGQHRPGAQVGT